MMECSQVSELLPWFANGSLAPEETEAIARHLDGCEGCRRELSETGAAFEIFGEHLPVAALVGMAFDGATDPVSRAVAESHLESCARCAEELALVRGSRQALAEAESDEDRRSEASESAPAAEPGGRVASFPVRAGEASSAPWRQVALAASLAALVSTVGWLSTWQGIGAPAAAPSAYRGAEDTLADAAAGEGEHLSLRERMAGAAGPVLNVPVVRAEPRGAAAGGEEIVNRVPGGADGVVLVLASRLAGEAPLACRLEAPDGSEVWTRQGLELRPEGGYTLRFSTARLAGGRYVLRLLGPEGRELESYPLSVD